MASRSALGVKDTIDPTITPMMDGDRSILRGMNPPVPLRGEVWDLGLDPI